ncbi:MAG TPA: alcohol dehydrogenase catalytic domain-containing protein [Actinomycetota bacterium]|jgi:S-(hydroxymethyl)mycothiol dehydrogenase|nr:alcohol dehydrogenase catalytic domain-containing protein [Actinomycetota bacterium]
MREARGVVVRGRGAPAKIERITVDEPETGEVLVRIVANGVCHSDLWAIQNGNWGAPFPMLLGHEGAGVVEAIGPEVTHVAPGDRVLLAWAMPCGTCAACLRGTPRRCAHVWDQPPRVHADDGSRLIGTLSLGSMATHTVVHGAQTVRIPDRVDLIEACLLGCGASTGIGAAVNTAGVTAGDTVAVIGLGGIGLSALLGAAMAGAARIIAIDRIAAKLDTALALGATDVIDAGVDDAVTAVRSLTDTGVDIAFEATGNAVVVSQAVAMLARGGTAVAIGVPAPDSTVTIPWGEATVGAAYPNKATLKITDGGDPVAEDFVGWLDALVDRRLDLRALVSTVAPFTDDALADAFRAMLAGEVIRTVITIDEPGPATGAGA